MKKPLLITAIGAATLVLGGCSLLGSGSESPGNGADGTGRPKSAANATAPQPQHVIASQKTTLDDDTARVDLTSLKQAGGTLTLEFTVTALTGHSSIGIQIGHLFTAEDAKPGAGSVNGITLIDGVNKKKHLVATDSQGECVCSQNLSSVFVKRGQTVSFTATFGAPPASAQKLDVQIPRVPVFHDIRIA